MRSPGQTDCQLLGGLGVGDGMEAERDAVDDLVAGVDGVVDRA
jgi:hypothetical protein